MDDKGQNRVQGRKFRRGLLIFALTYIVLALFFWGDDLRDFVEDRRERTRLRAAACERMVTLGYLLPDLGQACTRYAGTYQDGIATAVFSQTGRIQAKVAQETERLNDVTARLRLSGFVPLGMDEFAEEAMPRLPSERRDGHVAPEQVVVTAPRLIFTGFGDISLEDPLSVTDGNVASGVEVSVDTSLGDLNAGVLSNICRRTSSVATGCSGTLYLVRQDGVMSRYAAVGLHLAPVTTQQIDWTGIEMLSPPFADGSVAWQNAYMKRFLDNFPADGMRAAAGADMAVSEPAVDR